MKFTLNLVGSVLGLVRQSGIIEILIQQFCITLRGKKYLGEATNNTKPVRRLWLPVLPGWLPPPQLQALAP